MNQYPHCGVIQSDRTVMPVSVVTPFDPYYSDKSNQLHCPLYNEHVGCSSQRSCGKCQSAGARVS